MGDAMHFSQLASAILEMDSVASAISASWIIRIPRRPLLLLAQMPWRYNSVKKKTVSKFDLKLFSQTICKSAGILAKFPLRRRIFAKPSPSMVWTLS